MKTLLRNVRMRRARDQIHQLFEIGLIKIYLIGCKVPVFENCKKVLYHSTLMKTVANPKTRKIRGKTVVTATISNLIPWGTIKQKLCF